MKLPPTFKKDFTLSKKSKKELIETFDIPRVKSTKIRLQLPPHNFTKYGMKINDTF